MLPAFVQQCTAMQCLHDSQSHSLHAATGQDTGHLAQGNHKALPSQQLLAAVEAESDGSNAVPGGPSWGAGRGQHASIAVGGSLRLP